MVWVMSVTSETLEVRPPSGGALVHLGTREDLLADIGQAVQPGVAPRALVLLALDGFRDYAERVGPLESRTLVSHLATRLDEAVRPVGSCYRAREDEFAVLCAADGATLEPLVDHAAATMRDPALRVSVVVAWSSVVLPDEASDPVGALRLADQRLAANRPVRRAGSPPGPPVDDPLAAIHGELVEASATAVRMRQVDTLLDIADTLTSLADAARTENSADSGRLRGGPRDPARIPILTRELSLKLAALAAFGGPDIEAAAELVALPSAQFTAIPARVLAALDQIGMILSSP
jgi:GGDEF domain-containing protein